MALWFCVCFAEVVVCQCVCPQWFNVLEILPQVLALVTLFGRLP